MRARALLLIPLLAVAWAQAAGAVDDLYATEVLVTSQAAAEREAAIRDGLEEVLVRVSGRRATLDNPTVIAALGRAGRLLQQYSYGATEQTLEQPDPLGGPPLELPAQRLLLEFQAPLIVDLLRRAGEPILPANRPDVLLWLAIDDGERRLLTADAAPDWLDALQAEAGRRGLRLLLPLQDLEERLLVGPGTVWNYDDEPIDDMSRRYGADAVLVGRLLGTSSGTWLSDWRYEQDGELLAGEVRSDGWRPALATIVDFMAEAQSRRFAIRSVPGEARALPLRVEGIADFDDYVRVSRYLEGLTAVRAARVSHVRRGSSDFLVYTDAGLDGLRQEIELDGVLSPLAGDDAGTLRYGWQLP